MYMTCFLWALRKQTVRLASYTACHPQDYISCSPDPCVKEETDTQKRLRDPAKAVLLRKQDIWDETPGLLLTRPVFCAKAQRVWDTSVT